MARKNESPLDEALKWFIATPWWAGLIAVPGVYVLLGFVLPSLVQLSLPAAENAAAQSINQTFGRVIGTFAKEFAPWAAIVICALWLIGLVAQWQRRKLLNSTRDLDRLRALSWQKFEQLIGEYYRRHGFHIEERGGASPDGGVDLVLRKDGQITLVQCKHWKAFKVGVPQVRELLGVMTHVGAHDGVLAISGRFTSEAKEFAVNNRIELIDGQSLECMLQSVQTEDQRAPTAIANSSGQPHAERTPESAPTLACPQCGGAMVLRMARTGRYAGSQFYGCKRYPECRGIREVAGPSNSTPVDV